MKLGVIFPQTEIGSDPIAVRDFAQASESLGYEHLRVLEHVLGADASKRESWDWEWGAGRTITPRFPAGSTVGAAVSTSSLP